MSIFSKIWDKLFPPQPEPTDPVSTKSVVTTTESKETKTTK